MDRLRRIACARSESKYLDRSGEKHGSMKADIVDGASVSHESPQPHNQVNQTLILFCYRDYERAIQKEIFLHVA
jgi:hypothetical protein